MNYKIIQLIYYIYIFHYYEINIFYKNNKKNIPRKYKNIYII